MFVAEDSVVEVSPLIDAFVICNRVEFESRKECDTFSHTGDPISFKNDVSEMTDPTR
jgi:hypothetical protein